MIQALGARYRPTTTPVERVWAARKAWLANSPTLTIQGRLRQVHASSASAARRGCWPPPRPTAHPGSPTDADTAYGRPRSSCMDSCAKATG
jgi:hypothetical protein